MPRRQPKQISFECINELTHKYITHLYIPNDNHGIFFHTALIIQLSPLHQRAAFLSVPYTISFSMHLILQFLWLALNSLLSAEHHLWPYALALETAKEKSVEFGLDTDDCIFCQNDRPISTFSAVSRAIKVYCKNQNIDPKSIYKIRRIIISIMID